jgi:hypothetical protein
MAEAGEARTASPKELAKAALKPRVPAKTE